MESRQLVAQIERDIVELKEEVETITETIQNIIGSEEKNVITFPETGEINQKLEQMTSDIERLKVYGNSNSFNNNVEKKTIFLTKLQQLEKEKDEMIDELKQNEEIKKN